MTHDALATLGHIIDETAARDAVHIAVFPARATTHIPPSHPVRLDGKKARPTKDPERAVGIADPFLLGGANPGQWFWVMLFPRTITSLRHEWTHPKIDGGAERPTREQAEAWLRTFVKEADCPSYEAVLGEAVKHAVDGGHWGDDEHLHFDGFDAHGEIPPEFWECVEVITGVQVPIDRRASYFSCAC